MGSNLPSDRMRAGQTNLSSLIDGVIGNGYSNGLSETQKATKAWYQANGKKEETHTCGVWLMEANKAGELPTLVVYIDTNVMMQDFTTNKDIYKMRLERMGLKVADIQFRLSKWKKGEGPGSTKKSTEKEEKKPFEELSPDEIREIDEEVSVIKSDTLRQTIREAMISSKQFEDLENTLTNKTTR